MVTLSNQFGGPLFADQFEKQFQAKRQAGG